MPESITAEDLKRLDDGKVSPLHWKIMLVSGMEFFTDAYDLFIIGVAMALIKPEWHPNTIQVGLITSTALLASAVGAVLFGRGETEVLWVGYRNAQREVCSMEAHRLSQQAVVPLTGEIIQIVALSLPEGSPDATSARAFRVRVGQGICMRERCWHTTRVDTNEVTCLMLTRRSTTVDLVAHLTVATSLTESTITSISRMVIAE